MKNENIKDENNLLKGYIMMLYFSGSMVMFDPSTECVYDFWTKGMLKQLPVWSPNPDFVKAAALLRQSTERAQNKHELLKEDYLRLFSGIGKPLAPPVESVYRSDEHIMFDRNTEEIRNIYRKHSWESKFKNKIPDDHLGIELLFLTYLIEKYINSQAILERQSLTNEIVEFIQEHMLSWVPQWKDDVVNNASTLAYRGIALLVSASLEDIKKIIGENARK
ncbi:MAG TPA: molecular chaperone TorD family protein [Bacteroidales bacterium]|nr:molecular chaperone TorD family protein [Bacteroidales bacterium]